MKLCHFNDYLTSHHTLCFNAQLQPIRFKDFWLDVAAHVKYIAHLPEPTFALWEQDSYRFLVLFFALLSAKKRVILPPNQIQELQEQLAEDGIYFIEYQSLEKNENILTLTDELLDLSEVVFFTSGSTGKPKQILRSLRQLLCEVQGLAQSFDLAAEVVAIATVSHQHIYGLLFKVLLPLATGRSFYTEQLIYPEYVVQLQQKLAKHGYSNFVITSPALLKRWSEDVILSHCTAVYSSGGKLENGVREHINLPVIEVFGSSETGGIAHRNADHALWTPFADVDVRVDAQQQLQMRSLHACDNTWIDTGDRVELIQPENLKSPFQLLGRLDRLIKLEEKRLSLDEIEQKILQLDDVIQCHVLPIQHEQRVFLACVVVLNAASMQALKAQGKYAFVTQLKQRLQPILERIAIPRRWRFLSQLPVNSQSKISRSDMLNLFQQTQYPVVLSQQISDQKADYLLEFTPELSCFKGHFPNNPIYPGVGQIAFLQHFAKTLWPDLAHCVGFEQLKFQDLILPHQVLNLSFIRREQKVEFAIKDNQKVIASGRLVFSLVGDN